MRLIDLTGQVFGRLTVLGRSPAKTGDGHVKWACMCTCGGACDVSGKNLKRGIAKSCGCIRRENAHSIKHGQSHTATYEIWKSMRARCINPNDKRYTDYGGRGISIASEWNEFPVFLRDMGHRPDGASLDRIDNNGPYSKENCRWASAKQQARNKRTNSGWLHGGAWKSWAQWADDGCVSQQLLRSRVIKWGWDFETALTTPPYAKDRRDKDPLTGKFRQGVRG